MKRLTEQLIQANAVPAQGCTSGTCAVGSRDRTNDTRRLCRIHSFSLTHSLTLNMITSKFCIQNPTVCDNRYFAFFFRLGLDNIEHAAEMKQRREGSVQKMRAALKDKERRRRC